MNKRRFQVLLLIIGGLLLSISSFFVPVITGNKSKTPTISDQLTGVKDSIPAGLTKLKTAYPDFISNVEKNTVLWKDGTEMIYDVPFTTEDTSNESSLNNADLKDQMKMKYPLGSKYSIPFKNFDPGRIRCEAFFMKMYGPTRSMVLSNLVTITWLPKTTAKKIMVTKVNNVYKKLIAISNELEKNPELLKYVDTPGGAFYWRKIAGTERLSMHSFGIAIDINVNYSDYWKWDSKQGTNLLSYKNQIPLKIVEIFERFGFIWGGKWYHYDTMHFEYRPELLI